MSYVYVLQYLYIYYIKKSYYVISILHKKFFNKEIHIFANMFCKFQNLKSETTS